MVIGRDLVCVTGSIPSGPRSVRVVSVTTASPYEGHLSSRRLTWISIPEVERLELGRCEEAVACEMSLIGGGWPALPAHAQLRLYVSNVAPRFTFQASVDRNLIVNVAASAAEGHHR